MDEQKISLKKYIEDNLTPEQGEVCYYEEKNFVVYACPGSGKTRTVGTRFAWRMANWDTRKGGIAVLSFTNVAGEEIAKQLGRLGLSPRPPWPHFLGTIDSFVNQFIFLPFGHIVMQCGRRPELVHEQIVGHIDDLIRHQRLGACHRLGCIGTCFRYKANGSLEFRGRGRQPNCARDRCEEVKLVMVKKGFALYSDAMYWAMKILETGLIARVISARFPEIIIDEAQDTSETQVEIITKLVAAGCSVLLIGDPDQAIFSFNDARPDLFERFQIQVGWKVLPLSGNFRSSQSICNATHLFSRTLTAPARAMGNDKDFPIKPIILRYGVQSVAGIVQKFERILEKYQIQRSEAVVLARRHELVKRLQGKQHIEWPTGVRTLVKQFARSAVYRDNSLYAEAHETIMYAFLRLCFNKSTFGSHYEAIQEIGVRDWRRKTWKVLWALPKSDVHLSEWGPRVRKTVEEFLTKERWPSANNLGMVLTRCNHRDAGQAVSNFVKCKSQANGLTYKVIHQAKGETYEAVMIVAEGRRRGRKGDLDQWISPSREEEDERRVGYVGMTRPRKILVLAVPQESDLKWAGTHFEVVP